MATKRFLTLINNVRTLVEAITSSAGAGDAEKIIATGADGKLDVTFLPTGVGPDTASIASSENLAAGDYVNIWDDSGTPKVRKADASDITKQAHGFVLNNVTSPANATVYFEGRNTALTSLTPGVTYALDSTTPGGIVALASATNASGDIVQIVGIAVSATSLDTNISPPIEIA